MCQPNQSGCIDKFRGGNCITICSSSINLPQSENSWLAGPQEWEYADIKGHNRGQSKYSYIWVQGAGILITFCFDTGGNRTMRIPRRWGFHVKNHYIILYLFIFLNWKIENAKFSETAHYGRQANMSEANVSQWIPSKLLIPILPTIGNMGITNVITSI